TLIDEQRASRETRQSLSSANCGCHAFYSFAFFCPLRPAGAQAPGWMPERVARVAAPSGVREEVGRVEDPGARMWTPGAALARVGARARAVAQEPLVSEWRGQAASAWILTAGATQVLPARS